MTDSIIERCVRAILDDKPEWAGLRFGGDDDPEFEGVKQTVRENLANRYLEAPAEVMAEAAARAVIEAMRTPSDVMADAGEAVDGTITAKDVWQAMINKALE